MSAYIRRARSQRGHRSARSSAARAAHVRVTGRALLWLRTLSRHEEVKRNWQRQIRGSAWKSWAQSSRRYPTRCSESNSTPVKTFWPTCAARCDATTSRSCSGTGSKWNCHPMISKKAALSIGIKSPGSSGIATRSTGRCQAGQKVEGRPTCHCN